jgi:hypothetical protein
MVRFDSQVLIPDHGKYRWATHRRLLQLILPRGCSLTIGDGSPDPNDPTRFVIPYTMGTQHGTIVGRVQLDDSILLRVSSGPLMLFECGWPYVPIPGGMK